MFFGTRGARISINERRDIFLGDQPDALDQDFSIFMSKDIPQSHHALPRNLAVLLLVALRHSFSGLSYNKQLPFNAIAFNPNSGNG